MGSEMCIRDSIEDQRRTHKLRAQVEGVMVGVNTVLRDDPELTVRLSSGPNPVRIVVDSNLKTPLSAKVVNNEAPTIIFTTPNAPPGKVKNFEQRKVRVIIAGENRVNLVKALEELYQLGMRRIMLEGGGKLIWSMLNSNLVDEIYVTLAPQLLGRGVAIVRGRLHTPIRLRLVGIQQLQEEVVLHYEVKRGMRTGKEKEMVVEGE